MIDNRRLNEVANSLLGVRFIDDGRDRETGLDCLGLMIVFYREAFGIEIIECSPKSPEWIELARGEPGDVALMETRECGMIDHVGIVLPGGWLLQSIRGRSAVRSRLGLWRKKIARYARHKSFMPQASPG